MEQDTKLKGIKGWLVIPAIGLIITPALIYQSTIQMFVHHGYEQVLNILIMFFNLMFVFLLAITIYFFFNKRKNTPNLFIITSIVGILISLLVILNGLFGWHYMSDWSRFRFFGQFFRSLLFGVAWIPYFLFSQRVKATFTEDLNPAYGFEKLFIHLPKLLGGNDGKISEEMKALEARTKASRPQDPLHGINGWLILPAISLILSPLNQLRVVFQILSDDINLGINYLVIVVNTILAVFLILTAIFFFRKRKNAPHMFITAAIMQVVFMFIYLIWGIAIWRDLETASQVQLFGSFFQAIVYAAVWIPYYLTSKRVKATFIYDLNPDEGIDYVFLNFPAIWKKAAKWVYLSAGLILVVFLSVRGAQYSIRYRKYGAEQDLKYAAGSGNVKYLKKPFFFRADLNKPIDRIDPPLHIAARNGHFEVVKQLVERGANVNLTNFVGKTPLQSTLLTPDYTYLISPNYGLINSNNLKVARYLVDRGASVTQYNDFVLSPLFTALHGTNEELAMYFIEKGAKGRDVQELYYCLYASGFSPKLSEYFISQGAPVTNNMVLAAARTPEVVKMLVAKGADVNCKGYEGNAPLHFAAKGNLGGVVNALITAGADVNAVNNLGKKPIDEAVSSDSADAVKALISNRVNIRGAEGSRLLFTAIYNDATNVMAVLLDNGVDPNSRNQDRETALYYALYRKLPTISRILIEKGANVSLRDNDGGTPLHVAFKGDIALMLIQKGVNVNAVDRFGSTPLRNAISGGYTDVVKVLLENGADVKSKTPSFYYGQPPVSYLEYLNSLTGNYAEREKMRELFKEHGVE